MKRKPLLICSYYTKDTPYQDEVKGFLDSIGRHEKGVSVHLVETVNLKSWHKNTLYKPMILKKVVSDFREHTILMLDIDARLNRSLKNLPSKVYTSDISIYSNPIRACTPQCRFTDNCPEILTGTIFINYSPESIKLLDAWDNRNKSNRYAIIEQNNLQDVLHTIEGLTIFNLPEEYCSIFDNEFQRKHEPVITHYQASRDYKYKINGPNYDGEN